MKRLVVAFAGVSVGCASLDVDQRTERGPLLRTYTQEKVLGERVPFADVEARWPQVSLLLTTADICRTEQHAEYREDVISEPRSAPAAAAVSTGGVLTAAGTFLVAGRTLFSDEPDRSSIDREGHYGASHREVATAWGVGLLIVGVPALVAGIVQLATAKEETTTRKADELVALREVPCQPAPAEGLVELSGPLGAVVAPRPTREGGVVFTADELRGKDFTGVTLDGTPVIFRDTGRERLDLFHACVPLLDTPVDPRALAREAQVSPERLRVKRQLVQGCASIPEAPAAPLLEAIDAALVGEETPGGVPPRPPSEPPPTRPPPAEMPPARPPPEPPPMRPPPSEMPPARPPPDPPPGGVP